ncbi:MAG TPA: hypothetical protein VIS06_10660 [Mycobacteriales bacterium]
MATQALASQTTAQPRTEPARRPGGWRRPRLPGRPGRLRPRMALVLVAAIVVAALGAAELATMVRARSAPLATDTITLGGLTIQIESVDWVAFDSNDPALQDPSAAGGFKMPAQMMPDMPPDGQARLNVEVTLTDAGEAARALDTKNEFFLGGGQDNQSWKLQGDTFGELRRLNPANAVNGKLFFDLQPPRPSSPPLYLEWRRGGDTVRLLLVPGGNASTHHH